MRRVAGGFCGGFRKDIETFSLLRVFLLKWAVQINVYNVYDVEGDDAVCAFFLSSLIEMKEKSKFLVCAGIAWISALALWGWRRLNRHGVSVVVVSPDHDAHEFYKADLESQLEPYGVPVTSRLVKETPSIDYILNEDGVELKLCSIALPDQRVYRVVPPLVFRSACFAVLRACNNCPVDIAAIVEEVHEAAFSSIMRVPTSLSLSDDQRHRIPPFVYAATSQSALTAAKLYLYDVVSANQEPLISSSTVAFKVCEQAAECRGGNFHALREDIRAHFSSVDACEANSVEALARLLIENRMLFASFTLTTRGANMLEMIFGVPATHFSFLHCSSDSMVFVQQLYDAATGAFGKWTFENFAAFVHDVFSFDRPEIVRHVARIFRTLNRSRTGEISFEEFCGWIARKVSTRTLRHPDQHLVVTVMSLRLPFVFFMDKKALWPKLECAVRSLSEDDVNI
jgi:hypothetical protein